MENAECHQWKMTELKMQSQMQSWLTVLCDHKTVASHRQDSFHFYWTEICSLTCNFSICTLINGNNSTKLCFPEELNNP